MHLLRVRFFQHGGRRDEGGSLRNFPSRASAVILSLLVGLAHTPMASAEVNPNISLSSGQVDVLSPGESRKISNDENWTSIITEPSQQRGGAPTMTTYANDLAPACVNAVREWGFVQVYNNCGFDIRVKVVLAFGPDSACNVVVNGTRHNIAPAYGRIDRVEMC